MGAQSGRARWVRKVGAQRWARRVSAESVRAKCAQRVRKVCAKCAPEGVQRNMCTNVSAGRRHRKVCVTRCPRKMSVESNHGMCPPKSASGKSPLKLPNGKVSARKRPRKVSAGKCSPETVHRMVSPGKCPPESAHRKVCGTCLRKESAQCIREKCARSARGKCFRETSPKSAHERCSPENAHEK